METLLTTVKTTKRGNEQTTRPARKPSIEEGTSVSKENEEPRSLLQEVVKGHNQADGLTNFRTNHLKESVPNHPIAMTRRHKKQDSTAFLQKTYLKATTPPTSSSLPSDACEILKSQPDDEDLLAVLQYLQYGIEGRHDFNTRESTAKAAQIVNVLVTSTLVDHWHAWVSANASQTDERMRILFVACLTSVAGLGVLVAHLKQQNSSKNSQIQGSAVKDITSVLSELLMPTDIISTLLEGVLSPSKTFAFQRVAWQELCALIGGSKILGAVAQAFSKQKNNNSEDALRFWLGDGRSYSAWLANRIALAAKKLTVTEKEKYLMLGQLMRRGLSLGYRGKLMLHSKCS